MALVVLGATRSSPGVTTVALALGAVWQRGRHQALLVEADPDGGVIAARYGLGAHPNLTELAGRTRSGLRPTDVWDHAQVLPGGLGAVVAHPSADQTHAALRTGAARIGDHLSRVDSTDVLVDAGRLSPSSPALDLLPWASLIVVVLRPRLDEISALAQRLPALQELGEVGVVLVGTRPYGPSEVAANLGAEVLGVLANDPKGAAAIDGTGGSRRFGTSALVRSARVVVGALAARLDAGRAPAEDARGEERDPAEAVR
jgi:MinD-like ATPase involved in chromosome partitioning or flagellar assembly